MTTRVYLDWNATAPLRPEARAAMLSAMDLVGNPSSVHAEGRAARAAVERARAQVATAVGCAPGQVVFTSGATEAAGVLAGFGRVTVEPTAHDALAAHGQAGAAHEQAETLHAGGRRFADGPSVYATGLANSETGIVTPPPERSPGGWPVPGGRPADLLLLDITQAVGRIPFSFAWSGADMAVLSAHKLGGPKGVGALILREGLEIPALSLGGGQEMGRRAGTENTVGICGFGAAAEAALRDLDAGVMARIEKLRNILEQALATAFPMTIFVGQDAVRLPNTACIATPGWKAETQVMQMDLAGFAISAGSACSSGKVRPSRVLTAMGYDDDTARAAIRVSLGAQTTEDQVRRFCAAWVAARTRYGDRQSGPRMRREG